MLDDRKISLDYKENFARINKVYQVNQKNTMIIAVYSNLESPWTSFRFEYWADDAKSFGFFERFEMDTKKFYKTVSKENKERVQIEYIRYGQL